MRYRVVARGLAVVAFSVVALVLIGVGVLQYNISMTKVRAEEFCDSIYIGRDISEIEKPLGKSSFDKMILFSKSGEVVQVFKNSNEAAAGILGFSNGTISVLFQSKMPSFTACDIEVIQNSIKGKVINQHH